MENQKAPESRRLVIVSNRLPFQLVRDEGKLRVQQSDGGLVSALTSYFDGHSNKGSGFSSTLWIGSAGFREKTWSKFLKNNKLETRYDVEPVFVEPKTYSKYYNGFCNSTLWPLFHYFPSFVEYDAETFRSYEEVNNQFANQILKILKPGDLVWIHDYQLMLLPGMLRKHDAQLTIGFFLHIPFPSFEVFRLLHRPWKEKIVDGLLGADVIGFHTHEYVQHFLKTVQMIKGFDHQFRTIMLPGRSVKAEMFPLGIDFDKFHNAINRPEVRRQKEEIELNFPEKKIIFSVDRLDYTKGINHRLAGFESFLESNPHWRERVVFVLVVVPSRQIVSKYNERKKMIEQEIGRINGKYSTLSWQPIIYRYSHLSFDELTALYQASDVGLITPLRDGMNLVAKEYIASTRDKGVLILSELAGAANELGEAILVNPLDEKEVTDAISQALAMPEDIRQAKTEALQRRLKDYTVVHWMDDFLKQLDDVKALQRSQETRLLSDSAAARVMQQFTTANQRLLLLDYDGTLVPFSKNPADAKPDAILTRMLGQLASDPKTDVTIISGRDSQFLEHWLGALPLHLISEHGAGVRMKGHEWTYLQRIDPSWKDNIRPIFELFAQRSPGSFIEEKLHTLVWHYRNVDKELGFIRSRELLDSLHHLVRNSPIHIVDGNKVIEARMSGVDKGIVALNLINQKEYDFILAIGDDKTDEDMFRALAEQACTIKIGQGHTVAQFNLRTQPDAVEFLARLVQS